MKHETIQVASQGHQQAGDRSAASRQEVSIHGKPRETREPRLLHPSNVQRHEICQRYAAKLTYLSSSFSSSTRSPFISVSNISFSPPLRKAFDAGGGQPHVVSLASDGLLRFLEIASSPRRAGAAPSQTAQSITPNS